MLSAQFFVSLVTILIVVHVILIACAYLIFMERKVCAWAQDRIGPNRVNLSFGVLPIQHKMWGLGQALADGLKLLLKEDYTPPHVDRGLFVLAPVFVVVPALIGWAVIPWGGWWDFPGIPSEIPAVLSTPLIDLPMPLAGWSVPFVSGDYLVRPGMVSVAAAPISIGVVYILAIGSLAVYGVVLGAYASNNKYAFFGGVRASAQMVSYEIPMALCVLIMILTFATTDAGNIVNFQAGFGSDGAWGMFMHPLLAVVFFICILAECNRAPFDMAEAESELIGGYHTEYSSMKWAMFFLGEYMHMITGCAFFCVLFLGGWDVLPFVGEMPILVDGVFGLALVMLKATIFALKVWLLLFVMMWVRWTLPRFRFDQLMRLAWRGLVPLTLLVLLATGMLVFAGIKQWWAFCLVNLLVATGVALIGPKLPDRLPVNRKVQLAGSRFSPPGLAR